MLETSVMKRILFAFGALTLAASLVACPKPPAPPPPVNRVTVQQSGATILRSVAINTQVKFAATIENTTDQRVTWSIAEGGATRGTIDAEGNYTSPASVPSPAIATIRATSVATPSIFGEFQLAIIASGGISGTVTLGVGLLNAPVLLQSAQVNLQAVPSRQVTPDWQAARTQGEVLIVPNTGISVQSLSSQSATLRSTTSKTESGFIRVRVPNGTSDQTFAEKLALETGATVQPNYRYQLLDAPNDEFYNDQGNLVQIDAPGAWATQVNVPDGLVAVIDSGIKADHPDIAGRIILGKDFCPTFTTACQGEDNAPDDFAAAGGHGTFAAGMIAGVTNNKAGIAGLTHSGKVLTVKVFGQDAGGAGADTVALSKGIRYAVDQGAKVLSMSLGVCASQASAFDTPDKLTENAITYAVGKGAVLVAAAGNNGATGCPIPDPNDPQKTINDPSIMFPGNNPNVIAVGSVNGANVRSSFSATGAPLDIVAPGENLLSLSLLGAYERKSGTSFAAPQVAAIAALMMAKTPTLTRVEIQNILESTAKDLGSAGKDTSFGAGLLQAGAALSKAANTSAPQVKTSVYMYADRLRDAPLVSSNPPINCPTVITSNLDCFDGASALAGRAVVTINGTSGAVAYSITLSRNGQPLQAGTYVVTACINKNSNASACDAGDVGFFGTTVLNYNGTALPGNDLTLKTLP